MLVTGNRWIAKASDVRAQLKEPVYLVVERLMAKGWRLRDQGHKFYLYCPCGSGKVRVDGSPRDADWHATSIDRAAAKCPDRPH